jgi:hypothetical protein
MFLPESIICVFIVVVVAIILDVILGAIKAAKDDFDAFNLRTLPKFLASGILPYVGGLGILALAAQFVGDPFTALFYASAAAVTAKYVAEIKDKLEWIFGVVITHSDGIGEDDDGPAES